MVVNLMIIWHVLRILQALHRLIVAIIGWHRLLFVEGADRFRALVLHIVLATYLPMFLHGRQMLEVRLNI